MLLKRDGAMCHTTSAGDFFYKNIKPIIGDFETICAQTGKIPEHDSPALRFAIRDSHFSPILLLLVDRLHEIDPDVEIEIVKPPSGVDNLKMVGNGDVDVALDIAGIRTDSSEVDYYHACGSYLACVMPEEHPFASRSVIKIADLADQPLVMFRYTRGKNSRNHNRVIYRKIYKTHSQPGDITFADSSDIAMMLAKGCRKLTVVDSKRLVGMDGFVAVPLQENCFDDNGFYVRRGGQSEQVRKLIQATADIFNEPKLIGLGGKMIPKQQFLEEHAIRLV